jgi:polyhydroxyalkanoate synthase
MIRYLVDQGFTVFVVSWKNPDASMDDIGIEDYMDLGALEASDAAREITGSPKVNAMGYCIGGTLLTLTLATLAAKGDDRFNAASFMVSLQDYSRVGDTAVFMDEPAIDLIEQQMMERGYLDSREMSNMFNLLRSNDLIWSNVVNNYLMGAVLRGSLTVLNWLAVRSSTLPRKGIRSKFLSLTRICVWQHKLPSSSYL